MKKYDVYGVGNALIDTEVQVDDAILQDLGIKKNVMTLIDETTHHRLTDALASSFCHQGCGGSAANTMISLSQFGGRGFYSCKVADDEAGHLFLQELSALRIDCNLILENLSPGVTGQCLVLVVDDGERTMNTHLGISETLGMEVLDFSSIADSDYLYLEGYLITSLTARKALLAARRQARAANTKVALTLSDPTIVRYFKNELLAIIEDQVDLLFCNEEEAVLFTKAKHLESAIALLKPLTKQLIVTCGSQGALLAIGDEVIAIPTKASQPVDTVGAGDMFAGAYLYAITHSYPPQLAVELANKAATTVVNQYGARLRTQKVLALKEQFIAAHYSFA